ncbi:MAG: hypothetical protein REI64_01240 [Pedobacter sp.]|uniref:hypothetical protein n=1 Tax=Pedobacter sp. TaxID=1411316 RepID=UPI002808A25D|nr:hypothetical protein [Pedobacter sp.]MDQ8003389.1 hypothetical protein [Pedobacter sp.]
METKTIIITRKIQLLIDSEDAEVVKEAKAQLYQWQNICFKAANMIISHQFIQEQVKDFFYLTEDIKLKLSDKKKDEDGILTLSKEGTTYHVLASHFKGRVPMNMMANLNHSLLSYFSKEKAAYWKGEKSLRNYKKNIPIPFSGRSITKFTLTPDGRNYRFKLFKIPFRTYLGRDRSDKKIVMDRLRTGALQLRASHLQITQGKVFLLATIQMEKAQHELDPTVIAEASLSIEHPVVVKIGKYSYTIGSKEEFLHRRLAIQAAIYRVKKGASFNRGGHGRKRKMKSLDDYKQQEKRYVDYKLHVYSRMLINFCIKHNAATLLLVNQQAKEELAKEDHFLLQNWSYYSLKEKISYKAVKAGIQLIVE